MKYQQVYSKGALDPREPLYHSDPFYIEVNGNPEYANVTGTLIDNYSQIAIDLGKTNSGYITLGTRFNAMDVYILSANSISDILRLQSEILGHGMLKPRYVLGHHQACYGYSTDAELHEVADKYRSSGIPLDSIHVDVDFQNDFRTFTMDPENDPKRMFSTLREKGIKCSVNITPTISTRDPGPEGYSTLQEGLTHGRFILDDRYTKGISGKAQDVRYLNFSSGHADEIDPNDFSRRPDYGDDYNFVEKFHSLTPYRGAVSYGYFNGTPGYYVDISTESNRRWWGQQYQELFDLGVEFIWQDMTTPSIGEAYGDMKGFPSRLWLGSDAIKTRPQKQLAIEIWALYSYNLHKATYEGLCRLAGRENKRNFVLGRGSFTGMFRYAALWSGDNSSTWDFWRITIPQVLSMGLSGFGIFGSDTGGFEPAKKFPGTDNSEEEHYCSPELLIRWYAGSFLLPWLRNHYVRKSRKWFQEPYHYSTHYWNDLSIPKEQYHLYMAVERIIKYYVELRYSLMQLVYDAMVENLVTGLPIARSMLLTDPQDASLFHQSKEFLNNQYICGRNILVAPVMHSSIERPGNCRDVYLPQGFFWYHSNLRPWDDQVVALESPVEGGTVINYTARITNNYADFPCVTPVYIREGSIIPQLRVRQYVDDYRDGPNHMKFNIYPGKDLTYHTYLDDGVSRSSAPRRPHHSREPKAQNSQPAHIPPESESEEVEHCIHGCDLRANSEFRKVGVYQTSSKPMTDQSVRIIRIVQEHDNYDPQREVGNSYTLIVFYGEEVDVSKVQVDIDPKDIGERGTTNTTPALKSEKELRAVVVTIHETLGTTKEVIVSLSLEDRC